MKVIENWVKLLWLISIHIAIGFAIFGFWQRALALTLICVVLGISNMNISVNHNKKGE